MLQFQNLYADEDQTVNLCYPVDRFEARDDLKNRKGFNASMGTFLVGMAA